MFLLSFKYFLVKLATINSLNNIGLFSLEFARRAKVIARSTDSLLKRVLTFF